jgi:hypothetical protein
MKAKDDPENYKVVVSNCALYVKVAKMSDIIYKQIENMYAKTPILYQFRKFVAKEITVPVFNQDFVTGNLFPDSEIPCKLHFVLVSTISKNGDQKTNPFQFYRKYKITKEDNNTTSNLAIQIDQTCMFERLREMHNQNKSIQNQLLTVMQQLVKQTAATAAATAATAATAEVIPPQQSTSGVSTRGKLSVNFINNLQETFLRIIKV